MSPGSSPRWSPFAVGAGIGVLSWVTFGLMDQTPGTSATFVRWAGMIVSAFAKDHVLANPYYQEHLVDAPAVDWQMMLVLGTSGVVYPAAALPGQAKSRGAVIVEINPKRSELTYLADHFLQGASGEVLPRLTDKVKELRNAT